MKNELCKVMQTKVPRCVLEREGGEAARLQEDFCLKRGLNYATLCMCALLESGLKGNVPAIKQMVSLVGGKVEDEDGILAQIGLEEIFGDGNES